jgi:hypothetical protein
MDDPGGAMGNNGTAGGLGVGPRQNEQSRNLEELNRRLRKVEQGAQDDEDLEGKEVLFELVSGDQIIGNVIKVSKFRITVKLSSDTSMVSEGKEKVLYKSHIRWHEVI